MHIVIFDFLEWSRGARIMSGQSEEFCIGRFELDIQIWLLDWIGNCLSWLNNCMLRTLSSSSFVIGVGMQKLLEVTTEDLYEFV